jgi:lysozyme
MLDLCFNLGASRLATFVRFLRAMSIGNWTVAAAELMASKWYGQVGKRGPEIVALIQNEEWPT